jgi:hypothetical protein
MLCDILKAVYFGPLESCSYFLSFSAVDTLLSFCELFICREPFTVSKQLNMEQGWLVEYLQAREAPSILVCQFSTALKRLVNKSFE